ncbi:MAG: hypothetical protein R3266_03470, partial [Gemmatimonadota bacterium]|nr:hypothetical protein [Gemmatimonadota bacterium]
MSDDTGRLGSFVRELRRRHVFRVAILYAIVAFGIVEAADLLFPRLGLPDWAVQLVLGLAIVGLPVALILAWALQLTPEGVRTERAIRAEEEKDLREPSPGSSGSPGPGAAPAASGLADIGSGAGRDTLLVLPFDNVSSDPENEY